MYSLSDCPQAHEVGVRLSRQRHCLNLTMSFKAHWSLLLVRKDQSSERPTRRLVLFMIILMRHLCIDIHYSVTN